MIGYAILFALSASAQATAPQPAQPPLDSTPSRWPDAERELRQAGAFDNENTTTSRLGLEQWAGCLAKKNVSEAQRLLTMDFKSDDYKRGMMRLSQSDKECYRARGTMKAAGLLFAGELAEAMLERDATPLVSRLAGASTGDGTTAYSFTDKVAICVVRSVPNDVAALFATARGSAEENARLNALATPMGMCAKAAEARKPISVNPAGLRAMLATASYRLIASKAAEPRA